eukprot:Lithocolla_globosa_v1_NODE_100_length_6365_cov_5.402377.p5 type:complete len:128 gc:universal NODE_100_length_6365_cov_5.402377:2284-2667(+)
MVKEGCHAEQARTGRSVLFHQRVLPLELIQSQRGPALPPGFLGFFQLVEPKHRQQCQQEHATWPRHSSGKNPRQEVPVLLVLAIQKPNTYFSCSVSPPTQVAALPVSLSCHGNHPEHVLKYLLIYCS